MKIRTDYVSNSSSSSFIIGDMNGMLSHFNIGKEDLENALQELTGFKPTDINNLSVYDLSNNNDRKKIDETIAWCLKEFEANMCYVNPYTNKLIVDDHACSGWNDVITGIENGLGTYIPYVNTMEELDDITIDLYEKRNENGEFIGYEKGPLPDYIKEFLIKIRKQFGILSNYELTKRPEAKYVIHFGDNDISCLQDFHMVGKNEKLKRVDYGELSEYQKKLNEEIRNSPYVTEDSTYERFCEILCNYWESTGKINKDDQFFNGMNPFIHLMECVLSCRMHEG